MSIISLRWGRSFPKPALTCVKLYDEVWPLRLPCVWVSFSVDLPVASTWEKNDPNVPKLAYVTYKATLLLVENQVAWKISQFSLRLTETATTIFVFVSTFKWTAFTGISGTLYVT